MYCSSTVPHCVAQSLLSCVFIIIAQNSYSRLLNAVSCSHCQLGRNVWHVLWLALRLCGSVCVPVIGDDTQMTAAGNSISLPHTKKSKPISKYFRSFYLLFLRKVFTLSHVAGALKWHKHMLHMVYKLIYIYLSSPSLSLSPPLSLLLHMQHAK